MWVWISTDFNCENIKTWSVDIQDLQVKTKKPQKNQTQNKQQSNKQNQKKITQEEENIL